MHTPIRRETLLPYFQIQRKMGMKALAVSKLKISLWFLKCAIKANPLDILCEKGDAT